MDAGQVVINTKVDDKGFKQGLAKMDSAAQKSGQKIESTVKKTESGVETTVKKAGNQVENASKKAGDSAEKAAKNAEAGVKSSAKRAGDSASKAAKDAEQDVKSSSKQAGDTVSKESKQAEDAVKSSSKQATDHVKNSTKTMQDSTAKAGDNIRGVFKKIGVAVVAAFSVQQVIEFGKECLEAYHTQEEAELKLETVMKSRMGATKKQIQSVKDLTSHLQKQGVVGDEVQLAGAQQLATYTKQTGSLKKLIPAMNDLAVQQHGVNVTSQDMVGYGNLFGKAMMGNVGALQRYGITLTDHQKEIIKTGTEEQKAAALAEAVKQNVGNMNEEFAKTDAGKIQQAKNELGDMKEEIGAQLLPVVAAFVKEFAPAMGTVFQAIEKVAKFLQPFVQWVIKHADVILPIVGAIVSGIVAAQVVIPVITTIGGAVTTLFTAFSMIKSVPGMIAVVNAAIEASGGPVVWVIMAVVAAILLVVTHWDQCKKVILPIVDAIKNAILTAWNAIKTVTTTVFGAITGYLGNVFGTWFNSVGNTMNAIKNAFQAHGGGIKGVFFAIVAGIKSIWKGGFDVLNAITGGKLGEMVNAIKEKVESFKDAARKLIHGFIKGIKEKIKDAVNAVKGLGDKVVKGLKDKLGIHSPSVVAQRIAEFFTEGFRAGLHPDAYTQMADEATSSFTTSFQNGVKGQQVETGTATVDTKTTDATLLTDIQTQEGIVSAQQTAMQAASDQTYGTISTAATTSMTTAQDAIYNGLNAVFNRVNGSDQAAYRATLSAASQGTFDTIRAASNDKMNAALSVIRSMLAQIISTTRNQYGAMYGAGQQLMNGFINGMNAKRAQVTSTANSLVQQIKTVFQEGLGIHSPSVWGEWVGENLSQGIINGVVKKSPVKFVKSMMKDMTSSYGANKFNADTNVHYMDDGSLKEADWLDKNMNGGRVKNSGDGKGSKAMAEMLNLVNDNSHGYSQAHRWGPDYDCSSSIIHSLKVGGFDTGAASTTHNMAKELIPRGWQKVPNNGHPKRGDIVLDESSHVEWAVDEKQLAGFHSDYDGHTGDSSGREANVKGYYNHPWDFYLRYPNFGAGDTLAETIRNAYNQWKHPEMFMVSEGDSGEYGSAVGGVNRWSSTVLKALELTGQSKNHLGDILWAIKNESGGNPRAINNWDSNAKRGDPSRGLMQVIGATFRANKLPGLSDDIYDPLSNVVSGIRYILKNYGSIDKVMKGRRKKWHGYAVGSRYVPYDQYTMVHQGEAIIKKSENPYANSNGGFVTKLLQNAVAEDLAKGVGVGYSRQINTELASKDINMTQNVYFDKTPEKPSEMRAALRMEGRRLAFNG